MGSHGGCCCHLAWKLLPQSFHGFHSVAVGSAAPLRLRGGDAAVLLLLRGELGTASGEALQSGDRALSQVRDNIAAERARTGEWLPRGECTVTAGIAVGTGEDVRNVTVEHDRPCPFDANMEGEHVVAVAFDEQGDTG
eukprot:gnl/TRDRNA2_/TRDRNA2_164441_c1_seq1.p2 gnl/TRDRNA2_/TRDRNA2_164441_c1~~gnl/TRDRNA2_/TRDRNA2_164441_c1_seq1.p2  ORF type:complete len:138 (-),score=19.08 gnl/TRDRNA2_/TRDRNA2_164441_c1_seq1:104-517(-)